MHNKYLSLICLIFKREKFMRSLKNSLKRKIGITGAIIGVGAVVFKK